MSSDNAATHAHTAVGLRNIFEALSYPLTLKANGNYTATGPDLVAVGQALSAVVNKVPAWGRSYMLHALNGRQGSPLLHSAILSLGAQLDGVSPIIANVEEQQVLARPGQLHPQAVILADSVRCPGCSVAFVPRVPWQKYCSAQCRLDNC